MSTPARRSYYREARRLTRYGRHRHFMRYHCVGSFVAESPAGCEVSGENCAITITFESRPKRAKRLPPVLTSTGPVTHSWAVN